MKTYVGFGSQFLDFATLATHNFSNMFGRRHLNRLGNIPGTDSRSQWVQMDVFVVVWWQFSSAGRPVRRFGLEEPGTWHRAGVVVVCGIVVVWSEEARICHCVARECHFSHVLKNLKFKCQLGPNTEFLHGSSCANLRSTPTDKNLCVRTCV